MPTPRSDALVLFGATGDLAFKQIFPALQALVNSHGMNLPIIGVARQKWTEGRLRRRARDSVRHALREKRIKFDAAAFDSLAKNLHYVAGDYNDPTTFERLKKALGKARRPLHYLAIPPSMFGTVAQGLDKSGCASGARVVVEKPFGRDAASAHKLNATLKSVFPEDAIFRIDHFLGKEAIMNILYFRFANSFPEPIWNRNCVASVQITLSEAFGVAGRGAFYESAGCLRDVVQNHLFQIVALLAMEPPAYQGYGAVHVEKSKVFQAMRPLRPDDLVRGQYIGYRDEDGVDPHSDVETFCALKLFIDSWRWQGVPWYLRSGKFMAESAAEVLVRFKAPPQRLFDDSDPGQRAHQLSALPHLAGFGRGAGGEGQAAGQGIRRRPARVVPARGTARRRTALCATARRRDERRRRAVHARGFGRSRMGRARARAREPPSRPSLPPRQLGTARGPGAHCRRWRLAEPALGASDRIIRTQAETAIATFNLRGQRV